MLVLGLCMIIKVSGPDKKGIFVGAKFLILNNHHLLLVCSALVQNKSPNPNLLDHTLSIGLEYSERDILLFKNLIAVIFYRFSQAAPIGMIFR